MAENFNVYAFTDADIDSFIQRLQNLKADNCKYAAFTGDAGNVLICKEPVFNAIMQDNFSALSELEEDTEIYP